MAASDQARRQCKGEKASGGPCTRSPLRAAGAVKVGLPEEDQDYCASHHPLLTGSDRFGSRTQAAEAGKLGGRPRQPRVVDIIRERLEAEADEWFEVLRAARDAMEAVTVGFGRDAYLEMVPDHKTRLRALDVVLDRSYGRPKQQTEISGPEGGPVEVVSVRRQAAEVVGLLAGTGAVRERA